MAAAWTWSEATDERAMSSCWPRDALSDVSLSTEALRAAFSSWTTVKLRSATASLSCASESWEASEPAPVWVSGLAALAESSCFWRSADWSALLEKAAWDAARSALSFSDSFHAEASSSDQTSVVGLQARELIGVGGRRGRIGAAKVARQGEEGDREEAESECAFHGLGLLLCNESGLRAGDNPQLPPGRGPSGPRVRPVARRPAGAVPARADPPERGPRAPRRERAVPARDAGELPHALPDAYGEAGQGRGDGAAAPVEEDGPGGGRALVECEDDAGHAVAGVRGPSSQACARRPSAGGPPQTVDATRNSNN